MRGQFRSREEATEYNRRVTEISKRWDEQLKKAKEVMSEEDFKTYSKLVIEPIPSMEQANLLVKYKLLNPKYICPTEEPVWKEKRHS